MSDIDRVLAEFLRGQLLVMAVLAVYYAVGLSLVGLDRALAIGVLTGLLVFIPYVGFGLGLILGVLAAFLQCTGGLPSSRYWPSTASGSYWRRTCWCRCLSAIASACIRWR